MFEIVDVYGREILDSRGNPTVEVEVALADGTVGRAAVPSGASTGIYEALELRDKDPKRYNGKGVQKAVNNVNEVIAQEIRDIDATEQEFIDRTMCHLDDTENKAMLGANAILGVSMAVAVAAAKSLDIPLYRYLGGVKAKTIPVPICNVINGGCHADNALDIQEFMIDPVGFAEFREAIRASAEVFHALRSILKGKGLATGVGDEGGFAPNVGSTKEALDYIVEAIGKAGYKAGEDFFLSLDCAASEYYDEASKKYILKGENLTLTSDELSDYYMKTLAGYPILSIEDPFDQSDWEAWSAFTAKNPDKYIVGDDLFVTNVKRLQTGIEKKAASAILIKLNQIGTLTETFDAIRLAHENGMISIISHRSGETEDNFIADLSVATGSKLIKTGSLSRSDRLAKFNQLLRIEEQLGEYAKYIGKDALIKK